MNLTQHNIFSDGLAPRATARMARSLFRSWVQATQRDAMCKNKT
jgi:hypothetical protein